MELPDFVNGPLYRRGHELMHRGRVVALDEVRRPTASAEKLLEFIVLDTRQNGRIAYLVAIEMQDRQHGTVRHRIEELVGVPCGGQRAGFRLAVADDARYDQVRIVERGAEGMTEGIAELAAFVNGPGVVGAT